MDMSSISDMVNEAMAAGNNGAHIVIAILCGLMMSRFGQVLYFVVVALILDLVVFPLGMGVYENDWDVSGLMQSATDLVGGYMDNLKYVAVMAVFFLIANSIIFALKSVIRR